MHDGRPPPGRQPRRSNHAAQTRAVAGGDRLRRCATHRRCAYLRSRSCRGSGARRAAFRHGLRGQHAGLLRRRKL